MTSVIDSKTLQLTPETLQFRLSEPDQKVMVELTKMGRSFSGSARATAIKASALISSATHLAQMQAVAIAALVQHYKLPTSDQFNELPSELLELGLQALAAPPKQNESIESETVPTGLSVWQESKYTTDGTHLVNRASGEPIPLDEPVFVLRAKDPYAALLISLYLDMISNQEHRMAVMGVFNRFMTFRQVQAARMAAEPTTDLSKP